MTHPTVTASLSASLFIGLNLGDKSTHLCGLDGDRQVVERTSFKTTREPFAKHFAERPPCRIVLEVGSQSAWISKFLRVLGHDVLVADARRVAAITRCGRKTDRKDAETLARLLAGMPELLGAVHHRGEQAQADLARIRARDVLVHTRSRLILHVRGTLKSFGLKVGRCTPPTFHLAAADAVPELLRPALQPVLDSLQDLRQRIRDLDRLIEHAAERRYPVAQRFRQVGGVGPLTSLSFVLTIETPERFAKSRTVGAWVGLCPDVKASGDGDPALSISKKGCPYLRRLLVQSAHYIMGPFGGDCDLRRYGQRICERGGKNAKRRAVVAVARKLAVLMHAMWISGEDYDPHRRSKAAQAA